MEALSTPEGEESHGRHHGGHEPKQHVHKVNPDSVLHPRNCRIVGRIVVMNVFVAEDAKDCDP